MVIEGNVTAQPGGTAFVYELPDPDRPGERVYVTTHTAAVDLSAFVGKRVRVTIEVIGVGVARPGETS